MTRFSVDAIPFCYGPGVVALVLGEELARRGHEVRAAASGTTFELLRHSTLLDVTDTGEDEETRAESARRNRAWGDVYVNIMDPEIFSTIADVPSPSVYIDFLFFMTGAPVSQAALRSDLYLIEDYPGSKERLLSEGDTRPENMRLIPPILEAPDDAVSRRSNKLLVCFGGVESPLSRVGVNARYPGLMLPLVLEVARELEIDEVVVAAGKAAATALREDHQSHEDVRIVTLPHSEFLDEISMSSILVTAPGLYAPYEAFVRETPVVFLPPSNYSQVLQLAFYRGGLEVGCGLPWHDPILLGEDAHLDRDLPESVGVSEVLQRISAFGSRSDARLRFVRWLQNRLEFVHAHPDEVVRRQSDFLHTKWRPGSLTDTASLIESLA